jgi:hypothetical protein
MEAVSKLYIRVKKNIEKNENKSWLVLQLFCILNYE